MTEKTDEFSDIETWRTTSSVFHHRLTCIEQTAKDIDAKVSACATKQEIVELLDAWHNAQFTVKVVKWLVPIFSALATATVGSLMWMKDHWKS